MVLVGRKNKSGGEEGMQLQLGKYEIGRTLGEGNFGKVKYAKDIQTGHPFAVKILEKTRIKNLNFSDQIKREIGTLKILKHPNVVRLHEVLASKTKIYMILEYVNGGELFEAIASKGKLKESDGRKLFQQLIDGVSYCHDKGVYHRDLKDDGLLHTTCGSPNYVAPEILSNRGYDGATSDTWSCGVILYVILTGYLPFDDRNLAVLYQKIFKGDVQMPKWLPPGAKTLIKRILDPNPKTRITIAEIKANEWFKQDYTPAIVEEEEEDVLIDDEVLSLHEAPTDSEKETESPTHINAFELIGMSSCLDLSGFFEKESLSESGCFQDVSERKVRFTSTRSPRNLLERIENTVSEMGFGVQKRNGKLKVLEDQKGQRKSCNLSVTAEVFEINPCLYVVELRKTSGESSVYRQLCDKVLKDLGVSTSQEHLAAKLLEASS
ncbi:Kinase associated domain 1 (KA1) [Cynara cardunculus var. scolymus]|uniref:non-specific serine/threonine protein kinase n=1 Tax=Cynara cardunculus var. scolymus TaxID=59895 RepID=A0A118JXJ2_CYNCS|nr:Kinase associated domain 1 (KA1) [Cynara cardunculus var. scolymus]